MFILIESGVKDGVFMISLEFCCWFEMVCA